MVVKNKHPLTYFGALVTKALNLEDPIGTERPFWIDVSRWQGRVDFEVAMDMGILGVVARSTVSWGYQDSRFPYNYAVAGEKKMYRSSYHVLYPGQPLLDWGGRRGQIDNWFRVHPEIDVVPRVLDVELAMGQTRQRIADDVAKSVNIIMGRDGIAPIIYTRNLLARDWLQPFWTPDQMNEVWWWMAQYSRLPGVEHPGPPDFPISIRKDRVLLHQTSDSKEIHPDLSESRSTDTDRWLLGNEGSMDAWIGKNWGGEDKVPPLPPENNDDQVWNAAMDNVITHAEGEKI